MSAALWGGLLAFGYLYGVRVGMLAGVLLGRRQADSEWALWAEHGAL